VLALKNPDTGAIEFYQATALPFGASAAVHGFNRAASAVNFLLHSELGTPVTNYFDDFSVILPEELAGVADDVAKEFLDLIGWTIKADKSHNPMRQSFGVLGVEFDLSTISSDEGGSSVITVRNTKSRTNEIRRCIQGHLDRGSMSPAEASRLRGRLVFANSQTFGKIGALTYHHLGEKANQPGGSRTMSYELKWSLEWWMEHMTTAKERTIPVGKQKPPVIIFTDGSCEPSCKSPHGIKAGIGVVIYDPIDDYAEAYGGNLPEDLVGLLSNYGAKQQIVGQSELIPCVLAKSILKPWKERLKGRLVLAFVDNDAARYGIIKGSSPSRDSAWILHEYWTAEAELECNTWTERVPSASNCADGPSRNCWDNLKDLCAVVRRRKIPKTFYKALAARWSKNMDGVRAPRVGLGAVCKYGFA